MPTYRLTIEYEGTRYRGWQQQENARTVAGELIRAIEQAAEEAIELMGAGRTDAGVHALAQVAHLRLARAVEPQRFRDDVNTLLPPDIHVLSLQQAPERFHARHSASARSYLYQISRRRTALAKRFVWWVKRPLDVEAISQAASLLPGRHDFVLFCERPAQQSSTLVVMEGAEVGVHGDLVLVRLVASHFLWKMVRRLIGTLVQVGTGELKLQEFRSLLGGGPLPAGRGAPAKWTAPPSGLFLERVLYPGDPPLPKLSAAVPV